MVDRGVAQLPVPASDLELFAGGEHQGARQVDGVIGTQRMGASAFGRLRQQRLVNGMDVEPAPELLQVIERSSELRWGQACSLAHPS